MLKHGSKRESNENPLIPLVKMDALLTETERNNTCGYYGIILEYACKWYNGQKLEIAKPGKPDLRFVVDGKKRVVEVKENGGNFYTCGKGNTFIFYAVYIDMEKMLKDQFGYVIPMPAFREAAAAFNHIRSEKKDRGLTKMALQTLYNYSKGDFHGTKALKLAAMWEELGAISFKDFFKG